MRKGILLKRKRHACTFFKKKKRHLQGRGEGGGGAVPCTKKSLPTPKRDKVVHKGRVNLLHEEETSEKKRGGALKRILP